MNTIETQQKFDIRGASPPEPSEKSPEAPQPKAVTAPAPEAPAPEAAASETAAPPSAGLETPSLEEAVQAIQDYVDSLGRDLNFAVDEETGKVVVKVFRQSDGKLIRQIPSEELLNVARHTTGPEGLLLQEKV